MLACLGKAEGDAGILDDYARRAQGARRERRGKREKREKEMSNSSRHAFATSIVRVVSARFQVAGKNAILLIALSIVF